MLIYCFKSKNKGEIMSSLTTTLRTNLLDIGANVALDFACYYGAVSAVNYSGYLQYLPLEASGYLQYLTPVEAATAIATFSAVDSLVQRLIPCPLGRAVSLVAAFATSYFTHTAATALVNTALTSAVTYLPGSALATCSSLSIPPVALVIGTIFMVGALIKIAGR